MRRAALVLLAVMLCAGRSFGQSNGQPQWKVIKEFHVTDATNTFPQTVLFVPKKTGLYRLDAYWSVSSEAPQQAEWDAIFQWQDQTGLPSNGPAISLEPSSGTYYSYLPTITFSPKAGTPVTFLIEVSDPPPQNATYNLVFTIEQLTH